MENTQQSPITRHGKDAESRDLLWKNFKEYFWGLFCAHLLLRIFVYHQEISSKGLVVFLVLNLIVTFAMVWNVAWHAYLLGGRRKRNLLAGLLGFIWVGLVGIACAYYAVKSVYDTKPSQKHAEG